MEDKNNEMEQIYKEYILHLYKNPINKKDLEDFDVCLKDGNPLCGDKIEIKIKFDGDRVSDVGFLGEGCAISVAGACLLTEHIKGKTKKEIEEITEKEVLDLLSIPVSHT